MSPGFTLQDGKKLLFQEKSAPDVGLISEEIGSLFSNYSVL